MRQQYNNNKILINQQTKRSQTLHNLEQWVFVILVWTKIYARNIKYFAYFNDNLYMTHTKKYNHWTQLKHTSQMTHFYAYSYYRQLTFIFYKYVWWQLHNTFNEHKNNLNSFWCAESAVELLTMFWVQFQVNSSITD